MQKCTQVYTCPTFSARILSLYRFASDCKTKEASEEEGEGEGLAGEGRGGEQRGGGVAAVDGRSTSQIIKEEKW